MQVIAVAGPAGSGKSTLAAVLAARTRLPLLDLDTLTNPLLDALGAYLPSGHWNDDDWRSVVRPARYACLLAAAADQVRAGNGAIVVAPFTAELAGGDEWRRLLAAVAPATPLVCWLDPGAAVRAERIASRAESRDLVAGPGSARVPPVVAHLALDADRPTAELVDRVVSELAVRRAPAG